MNGWSAVGRKESILLRFYGRDKKTDRWMVGLVKLACFGKFLLAQQLASLPSTLADALRKAGVRRPRANLCAGSRFDACPKLDGIDTWSDMIG